MKRLWVILFVVLFSLSCKKDSTAKKITTEKKVKIEKAFLTLNFGDSRQIVKNKLQSLRLDGNIYRDAEFDDRSRDDNYKYLLEINKYDIENAMAFINPYYYENKLYKVGLAVLPFEAYYEYERYLERKVDIGEAPIALFKDDLFKNLHLAVNQLYIKKYGKYNRQIESETEGLFNRFWKIDNLRLEIKVGMVFVEINYIDNDIANLIKSRKIKTKDAI